MWFDFLRSTKKTPNSAKTAVQLVENVRTGSKVRQKIIRHFGTAMSEEEVEALKKLAVHYMAELENASKPTLFDTDTLAELTLTRRPRDEEDNRISKHDLRMRSIFHWTPRRIKAHIALCFMALVYVRTAEYRVNLQYKKLSPQAIRKALLGLEISILKDHKTGKVYALPSKATQDAKKIYQIMGLRWTDVPYLIK
jgi:hypothetical protein